MKPVLVMFFNNAKSLFNILVLFLPWDTESYILMSLSYFTAANAEYRNGFMESFSSQRENKTKFSLCVSYGHNDKLKGYIF